MFREIDFGARAIFVEITDEGEMDGIYLALLDPNEQTATWYASVPGGWMENSPDLGEKMKARADQELTNRAQGGSNAQH